MHAGDNHQRSQEQTQVPIKQYVIRYICLTRSPGAIYWSITSGSGGQGFSEPNEKVISARLKDHLTHENQSALAFY